jgi:hypothetical protein
MTITNTQIRTLHTEARLHGDYTMATWCELALAYAEDGDEGGASLLDPVTGDVVTRTQAREVCAQAIEAAAAMND